jgi:hypothetical protein
MKADWIGHTLRTHCFLKHVIEGKIERMRKGGRKRKMLLDDVKDNRRYWNLKEEVLIVLSAELALEEAADLLQGSRQ